MTRFFFKTHAVVLVALVLAASPAMSGNFGFTQALAEERKSELSEKRLKGSEAFIEKLGTSALDSLVGSEITADERAARFERLLRKNFDINTISRFALGRYWRVATPAEKKEYQKLFKDMIVDVYAHRFEEYSGQVLKVKGHVPVGKKDIIVQSDLVQPEGTKQKSQPVSLEWRVRYKDGAYKIIDVFVAGVSMSVTQRSDFAAVIERNGGKMEALLTSLKKRAEKSAAKTQSAKKS